MTASGTEKTRHKSREVIPGIERAPLIQQNSWADTLSVNVPEIRGSDLGDVAGYSDSNFLPAEVFGSSAMTQSFLTTIYKFELHKSLHFIWCNVSPVIDTCSYAIQHVKPSTCTYYDFSDLTILFKVYVNLLRQMTYKYDHELICITKTLFHSIHDNFKNITKKSVRITSDMLEIPNTSLCVIPYIGESKWIFLLHIACLNFTQLCRKKWHGISAWWEY